MVSKPDHIHGAYNEEFERLTKLFSQMGGLAESQFADSMKAVAKRDSDLALLVKEKDKEIDDLEQEVEHLVVRMLALRQPVANDLRYIVATLKTASDIERIGDYAKNIGKRAHVLSQLPLSPMARSIGRLGKLVQAMLKDVFDAYLEGDVDKAVSVWEADEEVDSLYTSIFRELLTYMMEDPRHITPCTHLLFIAKNIERIGDHTTNIAETLYFQVEGTNLDERRKKADASNYMVVQPEDEDQPEEKPA